jgi:hypothetical protein
VHAVFCEHLTCSRATLSWLWLCRISLVVGQWELWYRSRNPLGTFKCWIALVVARCELWYCSRNPLGTSCVGSVSLRRGANFDMARAAFLAVCVVVVLHTWKISLINYITTFMRDLESPQFGSLSHWLILSMEMNLHMFLVDSCCAWWSWGWYTVNMATAIAEFDCPEATSCFDQDDFQ